MDCQSLLFAIQGPCLLWGNCYNFQLLTFLLCLKIQPFQIGAHPVLLCRNKETIMGSSGQMDIIPYTAFVISINRSILTC